ncbi:MAG: hypothetical protein JST10_14510 [Bacteroidetes bacterium]|nr:hypothetical protein [Bacteroidota bacterium]MBS1633774.1 hypothetical protein [Bacteroidota bacterium]
MGKPIQFSKLLILKAGFIVGSLDILSALIDYHFITGKSPEGVLKYIASGIFGKDALTGGTAMLLLGLIFHFVIAYAFTIFYFQIYSKLKWVSGQPLFFAILYTLFMWAITHLVIMPLSNVPLKNRSDLYFWKIIKANLILFFMISLPLTLIAKRYYIRNLNKQDIH